MRFRQTVSAILRDQGFSYTLQRQFPFQYFTRSIVAVLCVLFVGFTVFNVATNGYDLETIVTKDPNTTLAVRRWFHNPIFTFGDDKLSPKCLSKDLAVGSSLITTNRGYSYILRNIYDADNNQLISIPYLNNTLQNCTVYSVQLDFQQGSEPAPGNDKWWNWNPSFASLVSYCHVEIPTGVFRLELKAFFDKDTETSEYRVEANYTTDAAAWWSSNMMDMYWMGVKQLMAQANARASSGWFRYNVINPVASLEQADAFNTDYNIFYPNVGISFPALDRISGAEFFNNETFAWSHAITEALSFAKVFHSRILIDLGDSKQPNLLSSNESLKAALSSPYNFNRGPSGRLCNSTYQDSYLICDMISPDRQRRVRLEDAYDAYSSQTGVLSTLPATIEAQYACSVPARKSKATIIWLTLLANFVLLQAAYGLAIAMATQLVTARDSTAMYCDGCHPQRTMHPLIALRSTHENTSDTQRLMGDHSTLQQDGSESGFATTTTPTVRARTSNHGEYELLDKSPDIADRPLNPGAGIQ